VENSPYAGIMSRRKTDMPRRGTSLRNNQMVASSSRAGRTDNRVRSGLGDRHGPSTSLNDRDLGASWEHDRGGLGQGHRGGRTAGTDDDSVLGESVQSSRRAGDKHRTGREDGGSHSVLPSSIHLQTPDFDARYSLMAVWTISSGGRRNRTVLSGV